MAPVTRTTSAPARTVTRPPAKSSNPFLTQMEEADKNKSAERYPQLNGGDSQSSASNYILRLTEFAAFSDRLGKKMYVKAIGEIVYVEDGYTGGTEMPEGQEKKPVGYAKAQKVGEQATILFFDPSDDEYGYGFQELMVIAKALGGDGSPARRISNMLTFMDFGDSKIVKAYREEMEDGLKQLLESNSDLDQADYPTESLPREEFKGETLERLVIVRAFLAPKGKKSEKRGQLAVTRRMTPYEVGDLPDFDYGEYVASAS